MKEITVYRTYSYGGTEGKTVEKRTFETEQLARENAKKDTWNDDFSLYRVVVTIDGIICEREEFIGKIICGCDEKLVAYEKKSIEDAKKAIETIKENKRIKETTRAKRIADQERRIAWAEEKIEAILKREW